MSRESRWRRLCGVAAILVCVSAGTGCLTLLAKSARDWATLAQRYSDAANESGMCAAGASHAKDAGDAAGRARDAATEAEDASASTGGPPDPAVLARVRQLVDAALPTYNAALESIRQADRENDIPAEQIANVVLANDRVDDDFAAAARTQLDTVLGAIETAELELLQMRRAMSADGVASSAALEEVQALRHKVAQESLPEAQAHRDEPELAAFRVLIDASERAGQMLTGLQRTIGAGAADTASVEARHAAYAAVLRAAEQTAREEAEAARVAAEAALSACDVAFSWSLEDPLEASYDEEESNQAGGYTPPPGP
ncbi:MAG: hypothetical protein ACHQ6V_10025 [Myxococcota bacterium]